MNAFMYCVIAGRLVYERVQSDVLRAKRERQGWATTAAEARAAPTPSKAASSRPSAVVTPPEEVTPAEAPVGAPMAIAEASYEELCAEAERLGLRVDKRWGLARLRAEVEAA